MTTTTAKKTTRRTPAPPPAGTAALLDLDDLVPHPRNPRRDLGDLGELADSIRTHGIRQNLLVVPDPDQGPGQPRRYRIVIGHRRAAAARLAGQATIPAVVDLDLDVAGQLELMLIENIQRADLTPVEEADGYQGLLDLGLDAGAIAARTGRSVKTVRSRLRLGALPEPARLAVHEHRATLEDAAKIEPFTDPEVAADLAAVLGTVNFRWHLEQAERSRQLDLAAAKCVKAFTALGIEVIHVERSDPNWVHAGVFGPQTFGMSVKATALKDLPAGSIASPSEGQRSWTLYRPAGADDAPATAAADNHADENHAQGIADTADAETLTAASRLRGEFLTGILSGAHPLTHAQSEWVLTWVARFAALTGYFGGEREELVGQWVALSGWDGDLTSWVDSVVPAYPVLAVAAAQFEDQPDDHGVGQWGTRLRSLRDYRNGWHTNPETIAWYGLLEQLGYPVSDVERAALTPPTAAANAGPDEAGVDR
jgi:ParB family chromosome partitioning protein